MPIWGAIEGGGTKFVCAVGTGPDDMKLIKYPTTTPAETLERAIEFFSAYKDLAAIGIGSFGPVDLHKDSPTWGFVTTTPKPGWQNASFARHIEQHFGVPVAFDTDVNTAALGEHRWGAGQGLDNLLYVTVGTGIGGGALVGGQLVHGLLHPEMGHLRIPHDPTADPFEGHCDYHRDCLEGLACGPAISKREEIRKAPYPQNHPFWDTLAGYLAYGVNNWVCTLSPQRVILGGGVMKRSGLIEKVRLRFSELINNYIQRPEITERLDQYIVSPALGDNSGVLGALALAQEASRRM